MTLRHKMNDNTFLTSNFDGPVLFNPAKIDNGHNVLKIITAFTDCERISRHVIELSDGIKEHIYVPKISIDLILGMTKSSLSLKKHRDICRLIKQFNSSRGMPIVNCHYIKEGSEVHSKIYLWGKKSNSNDVFYDLAYCGSLNYTMNAFYKRRESVASCDPIQAYEYYESLYRDTINCLDPDATLRIKNVSNNTEDDSLDDLDYEAYNRQAPVDTIKISLLSSKTGNTGYGSGVNWGIRPNGTKRNPNQAYIPYNVSDRKDGFFPDRINPDDKNCPIFKVITSDFGSFHMRMAQQGNKALQSAESNAILGEWLRKRLQVVSGGLITREMLENYGKTFVTFRKYADGTYLLDF